MDDPAADLGRDRARGQRVDEGAGRENSGNRMAPAHQRLGADHGAVREPDLRLEIQLELVLRIGAPQLEIEASARLRLRAQHRQEEPIGAPAGRLRLVEREVGIGDQLVDALAVVGRDRDAGAAADMQDVIPDRERLGEPLEHRIDDLAHDQRIAASGQITMNSSPPSRQTWPRSPATSTSRCPTSISSWSPVEWPSVSLTSLKPSRSNSAIAVGRRCRSAAAPAPSAGSGGWAGR